MGIGVILFFASNWEEIPRGIKLIAIYSALFASYYFGFSLCYVKQTYPRVGMALLLLGSILFGSAIALLAQIYNIHAHYPNGLLIWGAGVIPLAYAISSRAILTLGLGILSVWLGTEMSFWVDNIYYSEAEATYYLTLYGVWCVFLYSFGAVHTKFDFTKRFAGVYRYLSVVGILSLSFLLGFRYLGYGTLAGNGYLTLPMIVLEVLVIASVIAIIISVTYKNPNSRAFTYEIEGLSLFLIILLISFFIPEEGGWRDGSVIHPIVFNIILFSACVGMVLLGYWNRNTSYVNLGTFFIALQIFARYIEYSWSFMDRSLFFLVGGILMLAIGYVLERQRRKIVKQMKAG